MPSLKVEVRDDDHRHSVRLEIQSRSGCQEACQGHRDTRVFLPREVFSEKPRGVCWLVIGHHVVAVRRRDHKVATLHIYAKYGIGPLFGRLALLGGQVCVWVWTTLRDHRPPPWVCRRERDFLLSATGCLSYDPAMKKTPPTEAEAINDRRNEPLLNFRLRSILRPPSDRSSRKMLCSIPARS
jgi:hypothetical protein